jgi:SAM-dependent methyltransferase
LLSSTLVQGYIRGRSLLSRLVRNRRIRANCFSMVAELVSGRYGMEVGGPSGAFKRRFGVLPVYPLVGHLDNCNFASSTIWEGALVEGSSFVYDPAKPPGRQYVTEATSLTSVASAQYDFVLSSNTLEHSANPLKALGELTRILKEQGLLVLLLPHGEGTFDHRRPVTTLEHLVSDSRANTGEDDMTHFDEIIQFHDRSLDPAAGTPEQFLARSRKNFQNRCFHQHVFDTQLVVEVLDFAGMQLLAVETMAPHDIISVARKLRPGHQPDNEAFRSSDAPWRSASLFSRDRAS